MPEPERLPPTKDALTLHLMRCNHQMKEWKEALNVDHIPTNPVGRGWILEDGKLAV